MGTEVISTKDFESRIEGWFPFSQVGGNPTQWHGVPFECGCGETHYYNNLNTPMVMVLKKQDGGVVILSTECKYLIAIHFKGFFRFKINSLFSCKFEINEERFGFQRNEITNEIKDLISRFNDAWEGW